MQKAFYDFCKTLPADELLQFNKYISEFWLVNPMKSAISGEEALELLKNEKFDLIIGMDNSNMVRLRRFFRYIPPFQKSFPGFRPEARLSYER